MPAFVFHIFVVRNTIQQDKMARSSQISKRKCSAFVLCCLSSSQAGCPAFIQSPGEGIELQMLPLNLRLEGDFNSRQQYKQLLCYLRLFRQHDVAFSVSFNRS